MNTHHLPLCCFTLTAMLHISFQLGFFAFARCLRGLAPPLRPISAMWARSRLTTRPPFLPAARASSGVNVWALPNRCAVWPPRRAPPPGRLFVFLGAQGRESCLARVVFDRHFSPLLFPFSRGN